MLAKNDQSQVNFAYDQGGRLTSVRSHGLGAHSDFPDVTLEFGRDQNGNRTSLSAPLGDSSYEYDAADRLTRMTNHKGEAFTFNYDNANRLRSMSRYGSGSSTPFSTTDYTLDNANFLSSIVHNSRGSQLTAFTFTRDNVGNITQIQTPTLNRTLAYDQNNQITSATNPEAPGAKAHETFSYDGVFNRTSDETGNFAYQQNSSSKNTDRLVEDYKNFYFYDNNGNLYKTQAKAGFPNGAITNYTYSSENQLVGFKVYEPNNPNPVKEVVYVYDAIGRRIQKQGIDHTATEDKTKTFTRRYVYDGQDILVEYNESNEALARYTPLSSPDLEAQFPV